jgi:predicted TIM-barrel fold metal-dependent hydrolase
MFRTRGVDMADWKSIDRYMILSSDAHAGALSVDYRDYLPSQWHTEFDSWLAAVVNPWVDTNDARNWDSSDRLAAMEGEGVTGEVLFPNTLPPFYDILAHLSGVPRDRADFARRWAGLQAHNRWLVEFCDGAPAQRRGLIQLLPNDVDAAVAEMRWARAHDAIGGVMLPAVAPNHPVEPYYHERYEPLWSTAVELGFPIHQHQGSGSPDAWPGQDVGRALTFVDHELWTRLTMSHLIVGGVFERHPDLKVVWTEMPGLRWVVEDLERLTRQLRIVQSRFADDPLQLNFSRVFGSATTDGLSLTPLEYFQRNCYIGASILSPYDVHWINVLGSDRIMWGHDFPHPEGSTGHTTEALRANFAGFEIDECRDLFAGTAASVYRFDLEALAPIAARIGPPVELVHTPLAQSPAVPGSPFWEATELTDVLNRI